jgi:ADP-dependent phosphofructokinase/glucokinase
MDYSILKTIWLNNYKSVPKQLTEISKVNGLISAFNANIDAVKKISGHTIEKLIGEHVKNPSSLFEGKNFIEKKEDVFRGLINCFKNGIAEEWIISDINVYHWLEKTFGYDHLQQGGQGGIVANIMAVCGVNPVFVHSASISKKQSELFLDLPNLKSVNEHQEIKKAKDIIRTDDIPLIHYIIEFDKNDYFRFNGERITCPKSNRFIATYDPLNFKLHIDKNFAERITKPDVNYEFIILSGYQILQETIDKTLKGTDRIDESLKLVNAFKESSNNPIIHFEIASTQDKVIRKYLIDHIATQVESIGYNERELIDILEVIGEPELAKECNTDTGSVNLFRGMLKIFEYTQTPRAQLHMFGLYITLLKKGFKITPLQNRNGMQTAATLAAAKAGTGTLDIKENLLWAHEKTVSETGLNELAALSEFISSHFGTNTILETGIFSTDKFDIIAVPTILIDQPITLVGMGDTISSVSLVAAR